MKSTTTQQRSTGGRAPKASKPRNKQEIKVKRIEVDLNREKLRRKGPKPSYIKSVPVAQRNEYLASLMDPEGHQGVRFPDGFCQRTAMIPALVHEPVPYFPEGYTREEPGSFSIYVRPTALHPVWTYGKSTAAPGMVGGFVDEQSTYGLFPIDEGTPTVSAQAGSMILEDDVELNMKYPAIIAGCEWVQEPFKARTTQDGTVFYGQPISGFTTAANRYVTARIVVNGAGVVIGDTLTVTLVDGKGTTPITANIVAASNGQQVFDLPSTTINSMVPASSDTDVGSESGRPGVGIRLKWASSGGQNLEIMSFQCRFGGTAATARVLQYPMELDQEDLDVFLKSVELHRVVSLSALCSYTGATLTDGGQIAATTFLGGVHPNEMGFWNYKGIAESNTDPHVGALRHGSYCFWKPKDTGDMIMKPVVNPDEWQKPYIAIAGIVSSPDILAVLRIRAFGNHEVVTKARFLNSQYSKASNWKFQQAMAVLRSYPLAGENDTHIGNIRRFLSSVFDSGKKAVSWVNDNKGWLIPVVTAAASLL